MTKQVCSVCGGNIVQSFEPMPEWHMSGPLCGDCYSKRIGEHYPGDHVRIDTGTS